MKKLNKMKVASILDLLAVETAKRMYLLDGCVLNVDKLTRQLRDYVSGELDNFITGVPTFGFDLDNKCEPTDEQVILMDLVKRTYDLILSHHGRSTPEVLGETKNILANLIQFAPETVEQIRLEHLEKVCAQRDAALAEVGEMRKSISTDGSVIHNMKQELETAYQLIGKLMVEAELYMDAELLDMLKGKVGQS